ncbi:MAG: tetratricopeptide repeat protein [Salinivirgaceae bacterium]|jgi:tetratricopeptide (TPR) repeat protein
MRNVFSIILFFLIASILFSCSNKKNNEERKLVSVSDETISEVSSEERSVELSNSASKIFTRIGIPNTREDSLMMKKALTYLDEAIELDSLNMSARVNKKNIFVALSEYQSVITVLKGIQLIDTANYYNYMLEGFAYIKLDSIDEADFAFKKALSIFDKVVQEPLTEEQQLKKILLITILDGEEEGIIQLDNAIAKAGSKKLRMFKNIIEDFDINYFIDNSVFIKSQPLKMQKLN